MPHGRHLCLLAALVVVGCSSAAPTGAGSSPAATSSPIAAAPTAEASAPGTSIPVPGLTESFRSPRGGYSVRYPAGWTVKPASAPWPAGVSLTWGDPTLDELAGPSVRLTAASQPLASGQTEDAWLRAYGAGAGAPVDLSTWGRIAIGDRQGYVDADGVPALGGTIVPGGRLYDAVVVVDARAYNFTMDGELGHDFFAAVLATVSFHPAAATDAPPSP